LFVAVFRTLFRDRAVESRDVVPVRFVPMIR
jgi:hypothetical protein